MIVCFRILSSRIHLWGFQTFADPSGAAFCVWTFSELVRENFFRYLSQFLDSTLHAAQLFFAFCELPLEPRNQILRFDGSHGDNPKLRPPVV
jgi:hypothetical protein